MMKYSLAQYSWQRDHENVDKQTLNKLQTFFPDLSEKFLKLCIFRGYDTAEQIQEAINPEPQLFHSPFEFYQMGKAVERIMKGVENQEKILIYGDYDADGITSTLILLEALESLGAQVEYYLPNRYLDGYGPNLERWNQLIDEYHYDLIITCDNGVAGHEAIDSVNQKGVTVIVTDHHELQETLPDAYAIIHPNHPAGNYPFKELSGAGVALKVAHALLNEIPIESIELAAIGTVADMVSLTDENRTIVKSGLKLMGNTLRPGLIQLLKSEGVALDKIDSDTIGFIIGPRLNAVGRLGDPSPALELLRSIDDEIARDYLVIVNEKNNERRSLSEKINQEVEARLERDDSLALVIVEASPKWSSGVLGIVAGQMMNKYQRPVLLFQYDQEEKVYKGSGRSIPSINLFDLLTSIKDLIMYFGGHAQAAGLTVSQDQWEDFNQALKTAILDYQGEILAPESIQVDMTLKVEDIIIDLVEQIELLGPFGMDNPKPLFLFEAVDLVEARNIGSHKQHLRLDVIQNKSDKIPVIGFSMAQQGQGLQIGQEINLLGHLNINEWQGRKQAQIILKDLGIKGHHWIDVRGSHIHQDLFKLSNALFIFDQPKNLDLCQKLMKANDSILYGEEPSKRIYENLVIMESPKDISLLHRIIHGLDFEKIYLGVYSQYSRYLAGPLQRQDFTQLYKFLWNNQELNYLEHFRAISNFLNIPYIKIYAMFQVFLEAEFVTMESGQLKFRLESDQVKLNLPQLQKFQEYESAYQAEALLNYQSISDIKNYFERN